MVVKKIYLNLLLLLQLHFRLFIQFKLIHHIGSPLLRFSHNIPINSEGVTAFIKSQNYILRKTLLVNSVGHARKYNSIWRSSTFVDSH